MDQFKKYIEGGIWLSLFFIAITFPLPFKISNIGIVSLIICWVTKKVIDRELPSFKFTSSSKKLIFFSFIALFAWELFSLFLTTDLVYGIKNLEGKLSLLIFPIILYDLKPGMQRCVQLSKSYIYSLAVCTIVLLMRSIVHYFQEGSLLTYHDFTGLLDFHAVFYSYYIFLAILLSIFLYVKVQLKSIEKVFIIGSIILSFVGLLISASKNVLVVTSLFMIVGLAVQVLKNKVRLRELLFTFLFLLIAIVSISQIQAVKDRVSELTQLNGIENLSKIQAGEKLEEKDIRKFNGTSLRVAFWYVGINKIMEENRLITGLTPGDRRAVMNEEYFKNGINPWFENYNIHNQFIQTLVELGLIGLIIYLLIHVGLIRLAINEKNYLLLVFVIGLVIFQMTESIIERNKGIVFFVFFLILLQQLNPLFNENRNSGN